MDIWSVALTAALRDPAKQPAAAEVLTRLRKLPDDALRIFQVEQYGSDSVAPHRADPMGEHEPTRLRFDR